MASQSVAQRALHFALIAVMIVAPLSVIVSLPWLKEQSNGVIYLFAGVAAALTVLAAVAFSILQDGKLDEWHRTASQFSTQWGYSAGACLIALLLALPPMHDLIVSIAANIAGVTDPDHKLVLLAFVFGFIATVLAQALSTVVISIVWVTLKSRAPREDA